MEVRAMTDIVRIDMFENHSGVRVVKYPEGPSGYTRPLESYISRAPLEEMVAWLKSHGWTVRQWPATPVIQGGARAWRDDPRPIRTTAEIKRKRDTYKDQIRVLTPDKLAQCTWTFDFAYEA
jgi:hypothetical protein